jgi:hypothetical protein
VAIAFFLTEMDIHDDHARGGDATNLMSLQQEAGAKAL